jgi:hypothetical protein
MIFATWIRPLALAGMLLAVPAFAQTLRPPPPPPPRPFPVVETEPLPVGATCVQDGEDVPVLHFAKVRFTLDRGPLFPRDGRDGGRLNLIPREIPLTVILRHDPTRIHDVSARLLAFLRARSDGPNNRAKLHILSTEYSAVCATPDEDDTPRPPRP